MSTTTNPSTASAPLSKPDPMKVITPEFRLSYPALFEAKAMDEQAKAKFSMVMLFPKTTDITALKEAAKAAARHKWGDKIPPKLRTPFRDGDEEKSDSDGYKGCIFVSASSLDRPGIIDQRRAPIAAGDQRLFAGCYCRASLRAFAYDTSGNKGIAFALHNVQLLRPGQPFGSRRAAEDEFEEVAAPAETGSADLNF